MKFIVIESHLRNWNGKTELSAGVITADSTEEALEQRSKRLKDGDRIVAISHPIREPDFYGLREVRYVPPTGGHHEVVSGDWIDKVVRHAE